MNNRTFLILGGYGHVGRCLSRLLLQETSVKLVLAGRDEQKARAAADEWNRLFEGSRVTGIYADVTHAWSLDSLLRGMELVIVASSTARNTGQIASAALLAGCDYLDIHFGAGVYGVLASMEVSIQEAGRCFITGGGFHPGLPAAVIRYAAQYFDRVESAIVGSVINEDFGKYEISQSTSMEFVEEVVDYESMYYRDGAWQKASTVSTRDFVKMDFGGVYGTRQCAPMFFEELRSLPTAFPGLHHTGFYIAGINWFVDWVVFPVVFISMKLFPALLIRPMAALMRWGLVTFSKPPFGLVLKVEASGMKEGKSKAIAIRLSQVDGSYFTAIPVVACLLQYLNGGTRKPGLWLQATMVEPQRFMMDIRRMGIEVTEQGVSEP